MRNPFKLNTERNADDAKRSQTFAAFWFISAATTFLFGYYFLYPLFRPIIAIVPMTPDTLAMFSSIAGGVAAVVLLDAAYIRWEHIKLTSCETIEQYRAAQSAESMAFYGSLMYTVIALGTLVFNRLVNDELLAYLEIVGASSFVLVSVMHLVFWRTWTNNTPETRKRRTFAEIRGTKLSEQLEFEYKTQREALRQGMQQVRERDQKPMTERLAGQWREEVTRQHQIPQSRPSASPMPRPAVASMPPRHRTVQPPQQPTASAEEADDGDRFRESVRKTVARNAGRTPTTNRVSDDG